MDAGDSPQVHVWMTKMDLFPNFGGKVDVKDLNFHIADSPSSFKVWFSSFYLFYMFLYWYYEIVEAYMEFDIQGSYFVGSEWDTLFPREALVFP